MNRLITKVVSLPQYKRLSKTGRFGYLKENPLGPTVMDTVEEISAAARYIGESTGMDAEILELLAKTYYLGFPAANLVGYLSGRFPKYSLEKTSALMVEYYLEVPTNSLIVQTILGKSESMESQIIYSLHRILSVLGEYEFGMTLGLKATPNLLSLGTNHQERYLNIVSDLADILKKEGDITRYESYALGELIGLLAKDLLVAKFSREMPSPAKFDPLFDVLANMDHYDPIILVSGIGDNDLLYMEKLVEGKKIEGVYKYLNMYYSHLRDVYT